MSRRPSGAGRPAVSVVVPFRGDIEAAQRMLDALDRLEPADGDELIVADNTREGVVASLAFGSSRPRVVTATRERSSYHARNAGARVAGGEWLLFMDADCVPAPGLLDAHLIPLPEEDVGGMAGSIVAVAGQPGLIARYTRSRRFFDQHEGLHTKAGGAATANLIVRREVFEAVGGFAEGIRSAGDVDFSWRLQAAGWRLERRPDAVVQHRHREGFGGLMATIARYGAGSRWLNERHPGSSPRWPIPRALAGAAWDAAVNSVRGNREEAAFRAVDALGLIAHNVGYLSSNAARD